jgi:1-acyl-sn-glycerol-3-phosphate acyltransferase
MIFPEGTRSLDGEIKMFKNGAFLLALEHGFMIQPIVIDGAHSALASGSKLFNPKASFKMRVLDSIDPNNFDSMTALRDHSREILIDAHEELKKT